MLVPNRQFAEVPLEKIENYLLDRSHPDGAEKAEYFMGHGYSVEQPQELIDALRGHISEHQVVNARETRFGVTYGVQGAIRAPDGEFLVI